MDRQPTPGVITIGVASEVDVAGSMTTIRVLDAYPPPPTPELSLNPYVDSMRIRWRKVVTGRETELSGAYWCLSAIEKQYSGRSQAASRLGVSSGVLSRIGTLTAKNDPTQGRKDRGPTASLTQAESAWLRTFMPKLILRVAEVESGLPAAPLLTLALEDLSP